MRKIVSVSVLIILFIGCKIEDKKEAFVIDYNLNEIVKKNKNCLRVFKDKNGIDSLYVRENPYVESLINRFISHNKDEQFERIIFLRIDFTGDPYESIKIDVKFTTDQKIIVTRYKNQELAALSREVDNFDITKFLQKLSTINDGRSRHPASIFLIDFKSKDSCNCEFFSNIKHTEIQKIEDLSFFEQF